MALATLKPGSRGQAQSRNLITVDEAEIKRILTHAIGRRSGLTLSVRQCFLGEKGDNPLTFKQEDTEVSAVRVLGMTLQFCIGHLEYRVAGKDDMRRLNTWFERATVAIPKRQQYNNPDNRVLFRAFTTPTLN